MCAQGASQRTDLAALEFLIDLGIAGYLLVLGIGTEMVKPRGKAGQPLSAQIGNLLPDLFDAHGEVNSTEKVTIANAESSRVGHILSG
jgi:hypothetical protein